MVRSKGGKEVQSGETFANAVDLVATTNLYNPDNAPVSLFWTLDGDVIGADPNRVVVSTSSIKTHQLRLFQGSRLLKVFEFIVYDAPK